MIPAIRSLISIPAGMARMSLLPFLMLTAMGSMIWSALLAYAGFVLGANYEKVGIYIESVSHYVVLLMVLIFSYLLYRRIKTVWGKHD